MRQAGVILFRFQLGSHGGVFLRRRAFAVIAVDPGCFCHKWSAEFSGEDRVFNFFLPVIPLRRTEIPSSKDELAHAIDHEVRRYVHKTGPIVDVRSRVFPYIDEIAINLDGAQLGLVDAERPKLSGEGKPAFEVAMVNINARNVGLRGTPINLRFEARDLFLHQALDAKGEIVLFPHKIRDGTISISAAQLDLETAITKIIAHEAQTYGITIEQVRLTLRQRGPLSVGAEVRIEARKFFVRAKIDVYGQFDVDEHFVAKISQLRCEGVGAIASRACGALDPYLQRYNGQKFPLNALPLGETRVRDLRIAVTDDIEINVGFGIAREQS